MDFLKKLAINIALMTCIGQLSAQIGGINVAENNSNDVLTYELINNSDTTIVFSFIIIQEELLGIIQGDTTLLAYSSMSISFDCEDGDCDQYELVLSEPSSDRNLVRNETVGDSEHWPIQYLITDSSIQCRIINQNKEVITISLFDLLGRVVYLNSFSDKTDVHIPISDLSNGVYVLSCQYGNQRFVEKVVVRN